MIRWNAPAWMMDTTYGTDDLSSDVSYERGGQRQVVQTKLTSPWNHIISMVGPVLYFAQHAVAAVSYWTFGGRVHSDSSEALLDSYSSNVTSGLTLR